MAVSVFFLSNMSIVVPSWFVTITVVVEVRVKHPLKNLFFLAVFLYCSLRRSCLMIVSFFRFPLDVNIAAKRVKCVSRNSAFLKIVVGFCSCVSSSFLFGIVMSLELEEMSAFFKLLDSLRELVCKPCLCRSSSDHRV
jgi:hypothetical protein